MQSAARKILRVDASPIIHVVRIRIFIMNQDDDDVDVMARARC